VTHPDGSSNSNQVTTDVELMEVVAGQLQESRNELEATLRQLTGVVQSVPTVWRSDSATRFTGLMERWQTNNTELTRALDELAEAVRTSGRSYAAAVEEQAQSLSAIDPDAGSLLHGSFG